MSLGLVSPILNRGVRSRWVSTLPAGSKMLTIDAAGDVSYTDIPTAAWGSITGTLSNQTDLQNALNAKLSLTGGTLTGAILIPTGTAGAPSVAFADDTDAGIYRQTNAINFSIGGTLRQQFQGDGSIVLSGTDPYLIIGTSLALSRDGNDILAQKRATAAQTFRVYNTFTDASNYERGQLAWESNEFRIGATAAGTGTQRSSVLGVWTSAGVWHPSVVVGNRSIGDPNLWVTGSGGMIRMNRTGLVDMTLGEVNGDSFAIRNNGDSSVMFAVNATTKAATTYGQLTNALGTITASTPLTLTQTWNNAAVTFTGALVNVTDTASNASSLLMDLQVGGSSKFNVSKSGVITGVGGTLATGLYTSGRLTFAGTHAQLVSGGSALQFALSTGSGIVFAESSLYPVASFGGSFADNAIDIGLRPAIAGGSRFRDAYFAGTVNASKLYAYNTYTDASNYERGKIEWSSNVLRIGTEKAGTGSARALELQTDGTTRLTIGTTGTATFSAGVFAVAHVINQNIDMRSDTTDGVLLIQGYDTPGFNRLQLGGTTSSFPAIKRNAAAINFRLADDSADAGITASTATFSGDVTVSAINIVTDTTTGTKIGTATTQKIGFYNATPVVQPAAVADATDAASVITQLNLLLSRMRDLGLIAT